MQDKLERIFIMALVKKLESFSMDRSVVHGEVSATFTTFKDEAGTRYLQIDTYGSAEREIPGKKSQTLQFGPEGMARL
jgi:hypothetical protein